MGMPVYVIECHVSIWVKICVCVQATVHKLGAFFFFNGMRVLETDLQTAALAHISPLMHVFIRALGEAERAGQ